jgi:hypothetical protein
MRHIIMTCKNHLNLRWSCKEIAFSDAGGYNSMRNIFFNGVPSSDGMYSDGSGLDCEMIVNGKIVDECKCPARDLIRAPEDKKVRRYD